MSKENKNLSRSELISNFVISNSEYYIEEFKKIGSKPSYSFSFNLFATLCISDLVAKNSTWILAKSPYSGIN